MKKLLLIGIIIFFSCQFSYSQSTVVDSTGFFLQQWAATLQEDTTLSGRLTADSIVTKKLIQILKQPFSYRFRFDSLRSIKHIESPDGRFKFFTWQVDLGDGTYRQRGAMQLPSDDGQLKLFPFFDQSDFVSNSSLGISDPSHWIGAVYYEIIPITWKNETWYTLLGYDEYTNGISRKIIEVMHFEHGHPILGGDYFIYPKDPTFPIAPVDRFVLSYKKGSNAIIKYDTQNKVLVLSELTSTENDLRNPSTLVPSGVDLYFKWINGKWQILEKNN
jgi:hypothetical protein